MREADRQIRPITRSRNEKIPNCVYHAGRDARGFPCRARLQAPGESLRAGISVTVVLIGSVGRSLPNSNWVAGTSKLQRPDWHHIGGARIRSRAYEAPRLRSLRTKGRLRALAERKISVYAVPGATRDVGRQRGHSATFRLALEELFNESVCATALHTNRTPHSPNNPVAAR